MLNQTKQIRKKNYVTFLKSTILILFISFLFIQSSITYGQTTYPDPTIPSTGGATQNCVDCTPPNWQDTGGTPDVSNNTNAGVQSGDYGGGGATWQNGPLPLPPQGDERWITMRDLGTRDNVVEESVTTTMGNIVAGQLYRLTVHTMASITNQNGGQNNNQYYAGIYKTRYDYQVGRSSTELEVRQVVTTVTQNAWGENYYYFIGNPDNNGNMILYVYPGGYSTFNNNSNNLRTIEALNLAVDLNAVELVDTDGDGIPDVDDIDDDNDGILDTEELTINGVTYDPLGDEDGDLLPNYLDTDDDGNDGDGSTTDYTDANNDGVADVFDTDNDGIANHLDLDSDNDGIPDNIEAQSTTGYIAPSGVDADFDGLDDAYDGTGSNGLTAVDTDSDNIPDYLDLDADDDGIYDVEESGSGLANDGSGMVTGDVGVNGLVDAIETGSTDKAYTDVNGSYDNNQTNNFTDTDNDVSTANGDVDYRDSSLDADDDGILDSVDIDDDNDGILDVDEGYIEDTCIEYNGTIEASTSINNAANILGAPDGNFGTVYQGQSQFDFDFGQVYPAGTQYIITWRRRNDVTNGVAYIDLEESLDNTTYIPNSTKPTNSDNVNFKSDIVTSERDFRYINIDKGITNNVDFEIDAIGIYVNCGSSLDTDNDGIPDHLDLDSDNDGIPDNIEAQTTTGYTAPTGTDADNDGLDDAYDATPNGNSDGTGSNGISVVDTDLDQTPDYLDLDSDDDGIYDVEESGSNLANDGSGKVTGAVGSNGLVDTIETGGVDGGYADVNGGYDDTQEDNFTDADNDVNTSYGDVDYRDDAFNADTDNDGIPDSVDLDDDNDGIPDAVEVGDYCPTTTYVPLGASFTNTDTNTDGGTASGTVANLYTFDDAEATFSYQVLNNATWEDGVSSQGSTAGIDGDYINVQPIGTEFVTGDNYPEDINDIDVAVYKLKFNKEVYNLQFKWGGLDFEDRVDFIARANGVDVPVTITNINLNQFTITGQSVTGEENAGSNAPDNAVLVTIEGPVTEIIMIAGKNQNNVPTRLVTMQLFELTYCLPLDTDGDGIPDYLDLDSDNDGVPDIVEAGGEDTDGNGLVDDINADGTLVNDTDGDGLDDRYDSDNGGDDITNADSDNDGIPNYLDLDSDNDGIPDVVEAGGTDANGDGRADNYVDTDGDGFNDVVDGDVGNDGSSENSSNALILTGEDSDNDGVPDSYPNGDFDGDGILNQFDLDSDNDGILDVEEAGGTDDDRDGFADNFADLDGDGFNDTVDSDPTNALDTGTDTAGTNTTNALIVTGEDSDNDGVPDSYPNGDADSDGNLNYLDIDADNDGIPDNIEGQTSLNYVAPSGVATGITDANNNGVDDEYENGSVIGLDPVNTDSDNDDIPDYLDLDSDNDGVLDIQENGHEYNTISGTDSDRDGLDDNFDDNDDSSILGFTVNDGLGNSDTVTNEASLEVAYGDADDDFNPGNGDLDYRDVLDSDNDGIPNNIDVDNDNDGIPDAVEFSNCKVNFVTDVVAYWSLDNNTNDISGNGNNERSDGNAPTYSTDAMQGTHSASFNGTSNEIRYSVNGGFMESTYSQISFSAWIKPNNLTGSRVIYEEGGTTHGAVLWLNDNILTFTTRSNSNQNDLQHPIEVVLDTWQHVAVTFNNGVLTVYIDGIPKTIDNSSEYTTIPGHGNDGGIGGAVGNSSSAGNIGHFSGLIDAARYSNSVAWSSEDIALEAVKCDNDGDGIPNYLDLDSDNDGIPDIVEAGGEDTDGNGKVDNINADGTLTNDADGNGLDDLYDSGNGGNDISNPDTDGDGVPDFLDLDSDNDGIADVVEAGGTDVDGDGLADNYVDSDNDGFNDVVDGDVGNDGTSENTANVLITTGADGNGDGIPDAYPNGDTDGDGVLDHLDLDADNDGIADVVEAGGTDANGDGRADNYVDADGDGFNDVVDGDVGNDGTSENTANVLITTGADTDNDGTPNAYPNGDTDGDGVLDHLDLDADNDGIADVVEAGGTDANGDGRADNYVDADGDGFNDVVDGDPTNVLDTGYDGSGFNTNNALILTGADDNGDGTPDAYLNGDTDGDGVLDYLDLDADNDGIADVVEAGGTDANGDGRADNYADTDGDGFNDVVDGDVGNVLDTGVDTAGANTANALILTGTDGNGDGTPDAYPNGDTDGDGVLDHLDLDADNDGIADVVEAGGTDANGDGRADNYADTDGDGFNDVVDGDVG
ncbi:LamG-like jellyroll fold domain-containing protein, partial [Polaribacter sargassicola]|uniref:LamG-like jellyroll fold domain-containing protein n=1 Tax=Polaribacter sargassicola TaxID=2836891 RepID=UPI001F386905